jgi:hypothetical protein
LNDFPEFDEAQKPSRELREIKDIQDPSIRWMRKRGWWCKKFVSPANRSVMDYLCGKDCWIELIEFKAPLKRLTPGQETEHDDARACGLRPVVFDNVDRLKQYILDVELFLKVGTWGQWVERRRLHARGHEQGKDL